MSGRLVEHRLGGIQIIGYSVAGEETVIAAPELNVCFDVGKAPSEILSVDSMQIYRGMDIGTAKPPEGMRREIPHHGLDLVDPGEECDVARYVRLVRPKLEEIERRGKLPLLVGGSGLYLRALVDGLCEAPSQDLDLRERLIARERQEGEGALHAELERVDAEGAGRIHPHDLRRVVRSLEVYFLTGTPLSRWQRETTQGFAKADQVRRIGLVCEREPLYRRIESRVDRWLGAGWLEEAKGLAARPLSKTAARALGYQELFAYLRGECGWEDTRRLIHRNTRRYARRQFTWFRADPRVRWVAVGHRSAEQVAEEILESAGALR